jgi:hypothetical protein
LTPNGSGVTQQEFDAYKTAAAVGTRPATETRDAWTILETSAPGPNVNPEATTYDLFGTQAAKTDYCKRLRRILAGRRQVGASTGVSPQTVDPIQYAIPLSTVLHTLPGTQWDYGISSNAPSVKFTYEADSMFIHYVGSEPSGGILNGAGDPIMNPTVKWVSIHNLFTSEIWYVTGNGKNNLTFVGPAWQDAKFSFSGVIETKDAWDAIQALGTKWNDQDDDVIIPILAQITATVHNGIGLCKPWTPSMETWSGNFVMFGPWTELEPAFRSGNLSELLDGPTGTLYNSAPPLTALTKNVSTPARLDTTKLLPHVMVFGSQTPPAIIQDPHWKLGSWMNTDIASSTQVALITQIKSCLGMTQVATVDFVCPTAATSRVTPSTWDVSQPVSDIRRPGPMDVSGIMDGSYLGSILTAVEIGGFDPVSRQREIVPSGFFAAQKYWATPHSVLRQFDKFYSGTKPQYGDYSTVNNYLLWMDPSADSTPTSALAHGLSEYKQGYFYNNWTPITTDASKIRLAFIVASPL